MKRKGLKKSILVFFLLISWIILPMVWANQALAAQEKIRLSYGGATTSSWFYMYSAALVNVWKQFVPEVDVTLIATPGSMSNYVPLDKGELDLAVGSNTGNYYAVQGIEITKEKLSNITVMLPCSMNFCHAVTYADSPMKGFKDQEGKRILVGPKASTGAVHTRQLFEALGMSAQYIYTTQAESIGMMKDRRADGMLYHVAAPWSGIMDIQTSRSLKLLSMTPDEQNKIAAGIPFSIPTIIPAKAYDFQNEDIRTVSTRGGVNVRPGIPEEVVYKLTKIAWDRFDDLVRGIESLKWMKPEYILDLKAPLHPGAAKYYREIGVKVPDEMIWKKQ